MIYTYSHYKITEAEIFPFCPASYSRFKFGDDAIAATFGQQLANGFIHTYLSVVLPQQQLVVVSSPYSFIPTATFALKNHFVSFLNRWLAENSLPVVQETKVHRTITYKEDYGELSAEQRISLISNDSFHIDAAFLQGKTLLFLDDIRITGSHERMILNMVETFGLKNSIFMLYFAELTNPSVHPRVENHLNYYEVKSIHHLTPIIQSGRFFINTRIVKYILNTEPALFRHFIRLQTLDFINLLYDMAIGNSYHAIEAYSENLNFIKHDLSLHQTKPINHGH